MRSDRHSLFSKKSPKLKIMSLRRYNTDSNGVNTCLSTDTVSTTVGDTIHLPVNYSRIYSFRALWIPGSMDSGEYIWTGAYYWCNYVPTSLHLCPYLSISMTFHLYIYVPTSLYLCPYLSIYQIHHFKLRAHMWLVETAASSLTPTRIWK